MCAEVRGSNWVSCFVMLCLIHHFWLDWLDSKLPESFCLYSTWPWGYYTGMWAARPDILWGFWDPNSGLNAYVASALNKWATSQPPLTPLLKMGLPPRNRAALGKLLNSVLKYLPVQSGDNNNNISLTGVHEELNRTIYVTVCLVQKIVPINGTY